MPDALREALEALDALLAAVEQTRRWRAEKGMKPASDTSPFAMVPPSGLKEIEYQVKRARAALASPPVPPQDDALTEDEIKAATDAIAKVVRSGIMRWTYPEMAAAALSAAKLAARRSTPTEEVTQGYLIEGYTDCTSCQFEAPGLNALSLAAEHVRNNPGHLAGVEMHYGFGPVGAKS